MIKPFIWMFKYNEFYKDFFLFFKIFILCYIPVACCAFFFVNEINIIDLNSLLLQYILLFFIIILSILPFLFIQGYFWELTANIIERKSDIMASSICNGKVKNVYQIEFPKHNIFQYIWRGIASSVANVLMAIPLVLFFLICLSIGSVDNLVSDMVIGGLVAPAYLPLIIMYYFLVPGLLWNYASKNSVFSVWNIRKAIYIAGNYPFRYIFHSILLAILSFLISYIFSAVCFLLNINTFQIDNKISIIIPVTISFLISSYGVFVGAYLLGTIAKPGES